MNFANFLQLLVENDRFGYLPEIGQEFAAAVAQLKKSLALEVVSAFPLPSDERSSLETRIKGEFGAMASISWSVDPLILGGLLIKAGDKLLDGSVGGSLERIRAELVA
jgi:F-type H+-transporting ATPase subunit delta